MRGSVTWMKSSGLWVERATRSSVWQPTQPSIAFFCWSLPGKLASHSAVRELGGEILGLAQLQVLLRRLLRSHVHVGGTIEVVADRPDAQ